MIVENVPLQILTLDATQLVKVGRKGSLTRRLYIVHTHNAS
jgi:hypothetical protein